MGSRRMEYRKNIIPLSATLAGITGAILLLIGLIFTLYANNAIVDNSLRKKDTLVNGTSRFNVWKESPDFFLKVYFFNITNPVEVTNGETPIIQEIGPYIYDFRIEKVDLTFPEDDIIEYRQKFTCFFNSFFSEPRTESDIITTMDFALIGSILTAADYVGEQMSRVKMAIDKIFPNRQTPFITDNVSNLLFNGIEMDCSDRGNMIYLLCRQLTINGPMFFWKDENRAIRFALLHDKNITKPNVYRVYQGTKDLKQRGMIQQFNGKPDIDTWYDSYCNMINGSSSGELFPTHITKRSRLYYFEDLLGRSLYADFLKSSTVYDIDTLRFEVTEALFGTPERFPENECFCVRGLAEKENQADPLFCSPHGILNLAPHTKVPILVSQPYFIFADHNPLDDVNFTSVNEPKINLLTFMEVEPVTGTPIIGKKALQFNMELRPISDFPFLEKIQPRILPALRVEQTYDMYNGGATTLHLLIYELDRLNLSFTLSWCFIGFGLVILLIAISILLYHYSERQRKDSKVTVAGSKLSNEKQLGISSSSTLTMSPNKVCHQQNYM